jgi:hypothetical protein
LADAQRATGDRVHGGAVSRAVVGQQLLDGHAIAGEERDGAPEKDDRGARLLVGEDLGVGQAGGVVDGDVHVLPADRLAALALAVSAPGLVVLAQPVADAFAAPPWMRPSFFTSMWINRPARCAHSLRVLPSALFA